jgi:hypothetical protein
MAKWAPFGESASEIGEFGEFPEGQASMPLGARPPGSGVALPGCLGREREDRDVGCALAAFLSASLPRKPIRVILRYIRFSSSRRNAVIRTIANSRAHSGSQRRGCRNGSCKYVVGNRDAPEYSVKTTRRRRAHPRVRLSRDPTPARRITDEIYREVSPGT